jgi:hypothetical protein
MSSYRDREGRVRGSLVRLLVCLVVGCLTTAARAEGYLIEDGGLRGPASYDGEITGESVLVSPGGTGSFESLADQPPLTDEDGYTAEPAAGGDWYAAGCTDCGGRGCDACSDSAGHGHGLCGPACPRWVVQVDALMLWQGNIASRPLFLDDDGDTALDANQARTPMSAGPRVGLFYFVDQTHAIEGNYFNVRPFNGQAVAQPGQFLIADDLAGFTVAGFDGAQVLSSGAIQSAELNWRRRECWCPVTWIAGFRWVQWNQQMRVIPHFEGPVAKFLSETGNDLYGGQLGVDLGLWNGGGPFTVNGVAKAGLFYNTSYQRTSLTDSVDSESVGASANEPAFFGEVGVNGSLRLTHWLSWRVGYSLFWLSGVAVPAAQLSTTDLASPSPTASINTGGSVFLQGVTTGLEARW